MDHKKTYHNSILSEMKPRYKYKPKKAILDEEGRSYREYSELDFGSGSGPGSGQTPTKNRRRKKKPEPKTDIKALVNKFFDAPDTKDQGSDRSIDWDKRLFAFEAQGSRGFDLHRASSTVSADDYDDEGDFY